MGTTLNGRIASEIADLLVANGYSTCTPEDVFDVAKYGSVSEGTIGEEYDEALTDQIIDQLDSRDRGGVMSRRRSTSGGEFSVSGPGIDKSYHEAGPALSAAITFAERSRDSGTEDTFYVRDGDGDIIARATNDERGATGAWRAER